MKEKLFPNIKRLTFGFSIAILLITIIILMLRLTVFNTPSGDPKPATAKDDPTSVIKENLSKFEFKFAIDDKLVFKDFYASAKSNIRNNPDNQYYMQVKIITNETKALLYESPYIKPGFNEAAIKLAGQVLEAGTYEATAEIYALDPSSLKPLETYSAPIVIEITNSITPEKDLPEGDTTE